MRGWGGKVVPSPFFKCYPSDFLNGVAELTPHALAVYTICMMRMYDEDGPIPDDPVKIARRCNMRLPACEKALEELDSAAKITRVDGKIINPRVQQEVEKRREMSVKQSRNARGTNTRTPNSEHDEPEYDNKINGTPQPTASQTEATTEPTRSQKPEARKKDNPPIKPPLEKTNAKGTRLPETWEPDEKGRGYARSRGLDPGEELEAFRDHWLAKPRDNTKLDWARTWQTWCRNAVKFGGGISRRAGVTARRTPSEQQTDAARAIMAERHGAEAGAAGFGGGGADGSGRADADPDSGPVVELFSDGHGGFGTQDGSG